MEVTPVPAGPSLPAGRIEEFDIAPDGTVLVLVAGKLCNLATGATVAEAREPLHTFAVSEEGVTAVSRSGAIGPVANGEVRQEWWRPLDPCSIRAREDRRRLLLFGGTGRSELYSLERDHSPRLLMGSTETILAAGSDAHGVRFSLGNRLLVLHKAGDPLEVGQLPDRSAKIIGIAIGGPTVYIATPSAVYAMRDGRPVLLVRGIGGHLRLARDGLLVLDDSRRGIYRIAAAGIAAESYAAHVASAPGSRAGARR